jgi:predicted phage terminase large subunit-like protein
LIPPINDVHKYLLETSPKAWNLHSPHILLICKHLQDVVDGKIKRLAISLPPRSGKSETLCRFAAYMLEKHSEINLLCAGYSQSISRRFSRKTRTILHERVGSSLNHQSIDEWSIDNGSVYYVGSVNNPRTGVGYQCIICDDLIKNREEANSQAITDKLRDFYREDLYSRLEPDGTLILVGTRWSENDPIAYAVSLDDSFTVINIPALCDDEETDPLNRKLGDSIFPERYTAEDYLKIKEVVGEFGFSALYQGKPVPKDGGLFKADRIRIDIPGKILRKVRAYDLAASSGKGDFSTGILLGIDEKDHYWILDVYRGQDGTDKRDAKILQNCELDGRETRIRIPQDPGSAGKSLSHYFIKLLSGYLLNSPTVSGNKETRAEPFAIQVNAGNVSMIKAEWNKDLLKELETFPYGKYDDQVDSLSDAFDELTRNKPRKFSAV